MWFADIYCDLQWVLDRNGALGTKRKEFLAGKSESLGIEIEFHFYGDQERVRHIRVLMHTDDRHVAETCLNLNIQNWVTAIEVSVMLETNQPFQIRLLGSQKFIIGYNQSSTYIPVPQLHLQPPQLNYDRIAYGTATWGDERLGHYLFYFRRFIDSSLPLDVRWLNGYRLLEWHFVGKKANLSKKPEWQQFVARFEGEFRTLLRPNQKCEGLLEQARALAAHAGIDDRPVAERIRDPRNLLEKTFRIIEQMVATVLNEHSAMAERGISMQRATTN